ncbi:MAG TPA: trypsin-like peptidase domain-containing protein [Rectinemataceae bacterium]|nr:trypsin-like peptidase domain-containing protein [Rectinemataceae bacterium]
MKLYSRRQMTIGIAAAVFATAALIFGSAFLIARSGLFLAAKDNAPDSASIEATSATVTVAKEAKDGLISLASAVSTGSQASGSFAASSDENESISVYERFNESVVNITTEVVNINWFLDPVPESGGSGSGSIIDARGHVLTNYHVVEGAYKLFVNTADGSQYEASVVGVDPQNDLAVIKFDPPSGMKLRPISIGTSKGLKVGQKVLAIGNPFGLERTLTQGIVSGLGRPIQKDEKTILQNMIQTDASINPGNSGGPLFNAAGQMIGINTMIYTPSGGSVGIGFAIPIDTAERIVPELIAGGKVRRGWIDMEAIQLFPALLAYLQKSGQTSPVEKGLLVSAIQEGSSGAKAGLKGGNTAVRYGGSTFKIGGDIIVSVDGQSIDSIADLYTALEDNKPGEKVPVEFYRGKQRMNITVTLTEQVQQK